jgi:membrane associated rhomboid family serine protease
MPMDSVRECPVPGARQIQRGRQKRVYGGRGYRPAGGTGLGFGPSFTPPIIKQLLITLAAVFLAQNLIAPINALFAVRPVDVWQRGFLWEPFTYMWLHSGLFHIAVNCLMLWMFGSPLAMAWGPKRFLRFYLVCGVGAGVLISLVPYVFYLLGADSSLGIPTIGASGAIYGVVLAYSLTWPERTIIMFPFPIAFRAIWLIPSMFFLSVALDPGGNVSHVGHLSGAAVGWLYLRSTGDAGMHLSVAAIKHRWRRWRMRQKLRAVQYEEWESKRRERDRRYH